MLPTRLLTENWQEFYHKSGTVQEGTLGEKRLCFDAPFKWVASSLLLEGKLGGTKTCLRQNGER